MACTVSYRVGAAGVACRFQVRDGLAESSGSKSKQEIEWLSLPGRFSKQGKTPDI